MFVTIVLIIDPNVAVFTGEAVAQTKYACGY